MRDDLRGIIYIALKDMRTYYLKPPSLSWGIVFPFAWILAFYLRSPKSFVELVPGLIAMTILFSTTAAEAVVINFELRLKTLERLLLAPIKLSSVFLGKMLGGAIFGLITAFIVTISSAYLFHIHISIYLIMLIIVSSLTFSSLGALLCVSVTEVFEAQTLLNLPRFTMIFLSGVVYPISAMPKFLQYVAYAMPLTYTVNGIKASFSGNSNMALIDGGILLLFSIVFILPAIKFLYKKFE
ncbi:MAG: ABC transporter permease [Thermoplasmata archaeon]|nr:ABC transporter permease [Thermoplasmata archaeon]